MRKITISALLTALLMTLTSIAAPPQNWSPAKTGGFESVAEVDNETFIDGNKILMFVTNHGNFGRDLAGVFGNDYGTYYPYSTIEAIESGESDAGPVYAAGLWVGAIDSATGETRVIIAEYSDEYVPGPMAGGTFLPDNAAFRTYKLYADSGYNNPNQDWLEFPHGKTNQDGDVNPDHGAPWEPYYIIDSESGDTTGIDTIPKMIGSQTLWAVYNDADPAQHVNNSGETNPLGLEVRQTTFCFNREDALGEIIFFKLQVYNKGGNTLDSCFFSIWSDPDLGGSGDDLVGCDTTLSLGFCYNATNSDQDYGSNPPAVGYDFFQGPLEYTGDDIDTARMWDTTFAGYRNLPMYSFNKYINGTDPDDFQQTYNYMRGLNSDGTEYAYLGLPTRYFVSGDPVRGSGDLDIAPADRRLMLSTGPVTFRPGDSTEIVAAIVIARGTNRLTSVSRMKYYDRFAQFAYENNYEIPEPPIPPIVSVDQENARIVLSWTDTSEVDPGTYPFEGYGIFQGPTAAGPWTQITNYDIANSVEDIFDEVFDDATGVLEIRLVKNGENLGIKRFAVIDQDVIRGGPLRNSTTYYYRVEAYSYNPDAEVGKTQTSATVVSATPQGPIAGNEFSVFSGDTLEVEHPAGVSGGIVLPIVVDRAALTGDTYRIIFEDTLGLKVDSTYDFANDEYIFDSVNIGWHLENVTTSERLLEYQWNQTGDDDYMIVEGFVVKVSGPPTGFASMQVVANNCGELDPPSAGAFDFGNFPTGTDADGVPLRPDDAQQCVGSGLWGIHTADDGGSSGGGTRAFYEAFLSRATRDGANFARIDAYDFEMRFTGSNDDPGVDGGYAIEWFNDDNVFWVPFELWNIGKGTPDDPSDDFRMIPYIIDDGDDNTFSLESWGTEANGGGDLEHSVSGGDNDPYTDWVYWMNPADQSPGTAGYDVAEAAMLGGTYDGSQAGLEVLARVVLVSWNGGTEPPFAQDCPEEGTVFRLNTLKPNTPADTFTFVTEVLTVSQNEAALDAINVVPNPFYLNGPYDPAPGNTQIRFQHLPATCTISIYNLAGDLVDQIEKDDPSTSVATWGVRSSNLLPLASGIYIYVVEAPGFGSKVGKMAIFTEVEVLDIY